LCKTDLHDRFPKWSIPHQLFVHYRFYCSIYDCEQLVDRFPSVEITMYQVLCWCESCWTWSQYWFQWARLKLLMILEMYRCLFLGSLSCIRRHS